MTVMRAVLDLSEATRGDSRRTRAGSPASREQRCTELKVPHPEGVAPAESHNHSAPDFFSILLKYLQGVDTLDHSPEDESKGCNDQQAFHHLTPKRPG